MKNTKILVITLIAGFTMHQLALCQTNATDATPTDTNAAPAAAASPSMAAPVTADASNQPVNMAAGTNASAAPATMAGANEPAASAPMTEAASNVVTMVASNATAEATSTNAPEASGTNAPAAAELPISFQDVPITTAIESLARLANINYLLDPKLGYGQPDASGVIKPEPTLTIRWEHVTAQQALVALLDNYSLQLVENPKTGIYKITTKDPTAPPPLITRVVQLKYASTSNMMDAVQSTLTDKRSKVVADSRTSQLVLVATEKEQSDVDTMIAQLDKPTRQVLIETKLIELSSTPSTTKGVDWASTLQSQNLYAGNFSTFISQPSPGTTTIGSGGATVTTPPSPGLVSGLVNQTPNLIGSSSVQGFFPSPWFLNADGLHAVLSFLNSSSDAQVVSTPRVVTLDNQTATISVTRAFPIINIVAGTANTAGGSSITYSNLGTILMVTPRISANDYIWLKVNPVVSSFFGQDKQTINGLTDTADIFDIRSIDTQVLIPNAHTLVMGGLVKDNPNAQYSSVPFLGSIPVLGLAFRHENKSLEKDNLLIFITPTIVKETDFKPTTSDFLKSEPRTMKDPMDPHTMYDGAEPRGDWSNPLSSQDIEKNQAPSSEKTLSTP